MRSTLCLNSQQLASYHLAQDSESSLGPPSEQGRASGVSFGMFQSERERRRLEVVVEFDLHSSDVGNDFYHPRTSALCSLYISGLGLGL